MRTQEYWNDRFVSLNKAQFDKGEAYYANLKKQYAVAIRALERDLAGWYNRYAWNEGVTLTEAKKQLTAGELDAFKMTVEEYIEKGKTLHYSQQWALTLERASIRVHVSRLEAMKLQMQQQVEEVAAITQQSMGTHLANVYSEGYKRTIFELQKGFGIGHDFSKVNTNLVNKILSRPWAVDGKNFSERIWDNRVKLVNELNNVLAQNVARGVDPKNAITQIAARMEVSKVQAGRLVMTETAFFSSESTKDGMKELGVDRYEILSTLDSHTSEICRDLDGNVYELKDYAVGVNAPPFHPNCRTTTVPHFGDEKDIARAARNSADEGYYKVPGKMTYREWEKRFS